MHTHSERGSDAKTLTSFASIAQLVEQRIEKCKHFQSDLPKKLLEQ